MAKLPVIIRILLVVLMVTSIPMVSRATPVTNNNWVVFTPQGTNEVLNNPYMGFAPDARSGPYPFEHRLVYANLFWKDLEPEKGVIDFDKLDETLQLEEWASRGVQVIFRIVMDYPGEKKHKDIPGWLYDELNGDGTWYHNDYGQGFSPNYANPKLIAYHNLLIAKLGEHYDQDPRIAFIELGSLGHWGEWHTHEPIAFPKLRVTDQYVWHYLNSFPDKLLLMRRPHKIALDNKLGLFNDMFGAKDHTDNFISWFQHGYVSWLTQEKIPAMPDFWKYAPSGGEFADGSDGIEKYLSDAYIKRTLGQAQASHTSWLGPNVPVREETFSQFQANIEALERTMGYRFVLASETHSKQIQPGKKLAVSMLWKNTGSAPFYFKWPLELSLADAQGKIVVKTNTAEDIRKWLPGQVKSTQSIQLPSNLPEGTYTLCVAILDPQTNEPGIELAIKGKREDHRYELGQVIVKK